MDFYALTSQGVVYLFSTEEGVRDEPPPPSPPAPLPAPAHSK